jgi:hypothetical protein
MHIAAAAVAFICAGILLWAGTEKVVASRELVLTLEALSFPAWARRSARWLLPTAEIATGSSIIIWPTAESAQLAVATLGTMFALAGLWAMRLPDTVRCACFGAVGNRTLGLTQVLLLPVWLACAYMLTWNSWSSADGVQYLAALIVALCSVCVARLWPLWSSATTVREAIEESIAVHNSMIKAPTLDGDV